MFPFLLLEDITREYSNYFKKNIAITPLRFIKFLYAVHEANYKHINTCFCHSRPVTFRIFREALSTIKMFGRINQRINHAVFKVPFWKIHS